MLHTLTIFFHSATLWSKAFSSILRRSVLSRMWKFHRYWHQQWFQSPDFEHRSVQPRAMCCQYCCAIKSMLHVYCSSLETSPFPSRFECQLAILCRIIWDYINNSFEWSISYCEPQREHDKFQQRFEHKQVTFSIGQQLHDCNTPTNFSTNTFTDTNQIK